MFCAGRAEAEPTYCLQHDERFFPFSTQSAHFLISISVRGAIFWTTGYLTGGSSCTDVQTGAESLV